MRKIIIRDVQALTDTYRVTAYFWLVVPEKRFLGAQTSGLPEFGQSAPWGITDDEQAHFHKGLLVEHVFSADFALGTAADAAREILATEYNAQQDLLTKTVENTPDIPTGLSWDGATWAAADAKAIAAAEALAVK